MLLIGIISDKETIKYTDIYSKILQIKRKTKQKKRSSNLQESKKEETRIKNQRKQIIADQII